MAELELGSSARQDPLFDIRGRSALVTGGSKGLGLAFARVLAARGCDVAITARSRDDVEFAAAQLTAETGGRVLGYESDASTPSQVRDTVDKVVSAFGKIDILVCNAGDAPTSSPTTPDMFQSRFRWPGEQVRGEIQVEHGSPC